MQITASGLVHDAHSASPHQCSSAFTDIAITGDGTVLVTFRAGSERDSLDGHILLYAGNGLDGKWNLLYDGYGKCTWEDGTPGEVKTLSLVETRPGVLTATGLWVDRSDPALPFVNPRNQGILPMRIFHTTSTDGGRTWSPRRRMDVRPHRGASPVTEAVILCQTASSPSPTRPGRTTTTTARPTRAHTSAFPVTEAKRGPHFPPWPSTRTRANTSGMFE